MQTVETIETIVRLPKDLLEQAYQVNEDDQLSAVIEMALREFIKTRARAQRDKRELEIINANADKLNEEALDVLEYQQINW